MVRTATTKQLENYIRYSIRFLLRNGETAANLARRIGVTDVYLALFRNENRGAGKKLTQGFCNEFHSGSEEEMNLAALELAAGREPSAEVLLGTGGPKIQRRLRDCPRWRQLVEQARNGPEYIPTFAFEVIGELIVPFEPNVTAEWIRHTAKWYLSGMIPVQREQAERAFAQRELARKLLGDDPLAEILSPADIENLRRRLRQRQESSPKKK